MKKTLALLLTLTMLFTMVLPAGAFSFETVESVSTELPAEEVTSEAESAALAAEVIPGKNLFTGTTDLLTFDDETQADIFTPLDNMAKSVVKDPVSNYDESKKLDADGVYGNMLKLHRNANPGRHWTGWEIAQGFDGSRSYFFTWDEYVDMQDMSTIWAVLVDFKGAGKHEDVGMGNANNKWRNYRNIITPNRSSTRMWGKFSNVALVGDQSNPTVPTDWYIDNFGIYPMYKINYVKPDGTAETVEYLFPEGWEWKVENIATEYTVKSDNYPATFSKDGKIYKTIGWGLTENSDAPVTTVALENADITLYPVYEVTDFFTIDASAIAVNSGVATVTAKEAVTWSYTVVGATDATVSTTETTATVTAGAENGSVILTAIPVSDESMTVEAEILILGSPKWRPGHNLFTGTEKSFTFENVSKEIVGSIFANKYNQTSVLPNENKSGSNFSDTAFKLESAGTYPSFWTANFENPISTKRPVLIDYDYYGTFDCHWLMINGGGGDDIFKNMGSAGYGKTSSWKHVRVNRHTSESVRTYDQIKCLGFELGNKNIWAYFDNINITPYYQITYIGLDGNVAYTDYVLVDNDGNLLTEYTPNLEYVTGAVAYSLEANGDAVKKVELKNADITFYALATINGPLTFKTATGSKEVRPDYNKDYTVPSLADLGLEAEHFLAWVTGAGKVFKPGDVVKAADIDTIKGMTLTAFCQDLTQPAMGYAYEGDKALGFAKYNYQEVIEDEGRTVNHFRLFANTYEGSEWKNDARFHLRKDEGFDASEYNIVQYSYKIGSSINVTSVTAPKEPTADQLTGEIANPPITIYCMYNVNTFYGTGGTMTIGSDAVSKLVNDKQYHVVELDMSTSEHQSSSRLWTGGEAGKLYGFAVDMNRAYYSADTYVDYFRVYRDGIFTVNYNTNVPAGLEDAGLSQTDVAPDTGRGGGVGYLLKGEQPSLEGFTFRGWALKPDATPEETVTAIDLTGDTTVYAVWTEEITSPNVDKNNIGIRSGADKVNGIRFSSSVAVGDRNKLEEYGFIIAREDVLGSKELTFDFKAEGKNKPLYVYGAAYDKKNGIDYQYDNTGSKIVFTAVCTNIPAEHYATKLVARTYAKYAVNGSAFTVYGSSVTKSIKEIAQSIKDEGGAAYEENKDYIDSILNA